jgi:hypothetical protein
MNSRSHFDDGINAWGQDVSPPRPEEKEWLREMRPFDFADHVHDTVADQWMHERTFGESADEEDGEA